METLKNIFHTNHGPRIVIVGCITPLNRNVNPKAYFEEFKNLVSSNGIEPVAEYFFTLRTLHSGTFISKGKLEEIQRLCIEHKADELIFSEPLTPHQENALDKVLGIPVFDRTHLILEIFEKGAQSAEGKLQVAIAFLEHKKTRVAGHGKSMSQQAGGIGTKGPGETQKEKNLQHLDHLLLKLYRDLEHLQKVRETQRKQRVKRNLLQIALVGYTNAGKSTILNTLTKSNVKAENKLFATLDTATRELFIENRKIGLISDTVGFIQNIPHKLIDAFKSTLEELNYADLLLHVVDCSNSDWQSHIDVVNEVLTEIGVEKTPILYVFNKSDLVDPLKLSTFPFDRYQPHVVVEGTSREGLSQLMNYLANYNTTAEEKTNE